MYSSLINEDSLHQDFIYSSVYLGFQFTWCLVQTGVTLKSRQIKLSGLFLLSNLIYDSDTNFKIDVNIYTFKPGCVDDEMSKETDYFL